MQKRLILLSLALWVLGSACTVGPSTPGDPAQPASGVGNLPTTAPTAPALPPVTTALNTAVPVDNAPIPDLALTRTDIQLYPVPAIYDGDRVTFQLLPFVPESIPVQDVGVQIMVDGGTIHEDSLARRNWAGQAQGIYEWVWDTAGQTGEHTITVALDPADTIHSGDENPENNSVSFTITVNDQALLPQTVVDATWTTTESNCCTLHAVSGTAAARDAYMLAGLVDEAVAEASRRLNEPINRRLNIYFTDRVIGQGGFAGADMVIAYVDRQYTGGNLRELLVHEAVHVIDRQFAPQRIQFLAEGIAVWAAGGHYKPENLTERSAALLKLGKYIPLDRLISDFYPVQHEIGYLEAAGFATYLIEQYGWARFRDFYVNTTAGDGVNDAAAVDTNLRLSYNKTLPEIETEWLAYLQSQPVSEAALADLATTIRFYDVMRHYQMLYDPSAHFLSAWLPYPQAVREQGNTADLTRHPETAVNIAIETMLLNAAQDLEAQNYVRANAVLDSVARVLDNNGAFIDPVASSYLQIVEKAQLLGYIVQRIEMNADTAVAYANTPVNPKLVQLDLVLRSQGWALLD